jgi:hypothetical protein
MLLVVLVLPNIEFLSFVFIIAAKGIHFIILEYSLVKVSCRIEQDDSEAILLVVFPDAIKYVSLGRSREDTPALTILIPKFKN